MVSLLGTWMQQMAQGWVLAGLTSSALTLGLVNLASGVPMLALTLLGGTAADRFDKRRILLATQILQAFIAAALGWLVANGQIQVIHIVIAGVCLGITIAFEMPAGAALVPELVRREQLPAAIAIDRSVFHATRLAGPALGGWLVGQLGTASAFFANSLSYSALMIALLSLRPRARGDEAEEKQRQSGLKEGIAYVRSDRPTLAMLSLLALATTCISPFFMVLMPLYSRHVLGLAADQHGLLMGASGLGAFAGSLWLLAIRAHRRGAWLALSVSAIAAAMAGLALARSLPVAVAMIILLTLGTSTMFGLANTIVQERAPHAMRGRVSAIVALSFFGVLPFSGLAMAEVTDWLGQRQAMGLGAGVFALVGAWLLHRNRPAATQGT